MVSGNAAPGGILRFSLTDEGMIYGAASELLKNEKCMSVQSNAWQYGTLIHCERLVFLIQKENQKVLERDVCDGLFAQPTGICVKWNTVIMVHSAAKKLNIVVLSNGLNKYLHQLHNLVFCLGLIERTRNLKLETLIKLLSDCKKFMNLKSLR